MRYAPQRHILRSHLRDHRNVIAHLLDEPVDARFGESIAPDGGQVVLREVTLGEHLQQVLEQFARCVLHVRGYSTATFVS